MNKLLTNDEEMMKPIININDLDKFEEHEHDSFQGKYAMIGDMIGATKLGYNLTIVSPGKKSCPFHNHHINEEMFLILEGNGILRFGDKEYSVKANDIIACPSGGREVAHQLLNTGDSELKYLALSTKEQYEICEYPDSDKILSMVGDYSNRKLTHISNAENSLDYFEGEK